MEASFSPVTNEIARPAADQVLTVSLVICTRNRPGPLKNCLSAIGKMNKAPDQVIVVDNTPGDPETESVARGFGIDYAIESKPGLSRARNRGFRLSKYEIIAYLDDDATPAPNWLNAILTPFSNPEVGVVTGGTFASRSASSAADEAPIRYLSNKDKKWFEIAAFGGLGIGTNMAFRKSACKRLNLFDERLGRGAPLEGMEEHHAFVQVLADGSSAVHFPSAVVIHASLYPGEVSRSARNSIAYCFVLCADFPKMIPQLLRFLVGRVRRKPLTWPRDSKDPGEIVSSGKWSLMKSAIAGVFLYLKNLRRVTY